MTFGVGLGSALNPLGLRSATAVTFVPRQYAAVVEGVATDPALVVGQVALTADQLGVTYGLTPIKAQPALAEDDVGMTAALVDAQGVVMLERLRLALAQVPNHNFQFSMADIIGAAEALRVGVPVELADEIGTALDQQAVLSIQVIEELGLEPTLAPMFIYNRTMAEAIGLASSLANFFGADISETVGMASTLVGNATLPGAISEGIGISLTHAPQLVIRVTTTEEIGLEDVDVLQMIFSPELSEGISLTAAYISPGNSVTTWAMNTRTGAVTEYSNYAFNSFARLGDKYIGASSDGLYELLGDNDDGDNIVAQLKSGFAQWAGTKFTLFKAAYLGVRGEGNFVLRLITGEGQTYDYSVSTRDMRSTKVHMGKGIRTRYFRFELISTGQDFDLESLEFVPLVAERRV